MSVDLPPPECIESVPRIRGAIWPYPGVLALPIPLFIQISNNSAVAAGARDQAEAAPFVQIPSAQISPFRLVPLVPVFTMPGIRCTLAAGRLSPSKASTYLSVKGVAAAHTAGFGADKIISCSGLPLRASLPGSTPQSCHCQG